jgi:hypothetical protein
MDTGVGGEAVGEVVVGEAVVVEAVGGGRGGCHGGDEAVTDKDKAVAGGGKLAEARGSTREHTGAPGSTGDAAPQGALGTTVDQGYVHVATANKRQLCNHPDYCLNWAEPDSSYCRQHEVGGEGASGS